MMGELETKKKVPVRAASTAIIDTARSAALVGIVTVCWGCATPAMAQEFKVPYDANQYILEQTNAYRKQKGLPTLTAKGPANKAANQYAEFLAKNNKDGHTADGKQPHERVAANGGKSCRVWENVHHSWTSPQQATASEAMQKAMSFWKSSPGHEANLRSPSNGIGIGVFGWKHGDRYYYKAVQVFTAC